MTAGLLFRRATPLAAAMLLRVPSVLAQTPIPGVNVGVGQGGFSGSQEFVWSHSAPNFSLFLARPYTRGFWLQPEIGYTRKIGVSTTPISRLTLAADYLEFPLLFQFRLPYASVVSPFVHVGPNITVRLRCTLEFVGSGVRTVDDCDVVRGESSQKVDAILTGGLGIAWMTGGTRLSLEGRAGAGLVTSAAPIDATSPRSFAYSVLFGVSRALRRVSSPPAALPVPRPAVMRGIPAPGLPPIAAATIITPDTMFLAPPAAVRTTTDPLAALGPTRLVSVHAVNADVRTLLVAVARQGGLDLVVDGAVVGRVSVALEDVPVAEALRAIIQSAGLAISAPGAERAIAAVVFYQLPINVNTASAATIVARFGTSAELANFIVESRGAKPKAP